MAVRTQTLCMIFDEKRILLGKKKRKLGAGRWNGFGGNVEPGETIEQAAIREVSEEICVQVHDIKPRGAITFTSDVFADTLVVHMFVASRFSGEPQETEEMTPRWFPKDKIPYQEMWPDDILWLPHVLAGKSVSGAVHFKDMNTIKSHTIKIY